MNRRRRTLIIACLAIGLGIAGGFSAAGLVRAAAPPRAAATAPAPQHPSTPVKKEQRQPGHDEVQISFLAASRTSDMLAPVPVPFSTTALIPASCWGVRVVLPRPATRIALPERDLIDLPYPPSDTPLLE